MDIHDRLLSKALEQIAQGKDVAEVAEHYRRAVTWEYLPDDAVYAQLQGRAHMRTFLQIVHLEEEEARSALQNVA